jgi:sensor histidine kinase YesM
VLAGKMQDVGSGKLGVTLPRVPKNELGVVIRRFNEMSVNIADLVQRNGEILEEKRKLEIEALQAHINPHFIYNTLNMIKWMAVMTKSKNIVDSIVSLGNLLRPAFKSMDPMCTLSEEIDYIENYLRIMNWRFGNGITLEINVPGGLLCCRTPRFILQPVVENSVVHGLRLPENRIDIRIRATGQGGVLDIVISDTGTGIPGDMLAGIRDRLNGGAGYRGSHDDGSIGLYNVNRRIKLYFGVEYGLQLESRVGEGTDVTIRLPLAPE